MYGKYHTPQPNRWGGQDMRGEHGIARWTHEDGHRKVMLLDGLERERWTVEITHTAPRGVFDFAWQEAQWATAEAPLEPLPSPTG